MTIELQEVERLLDQARALQHDPQQMLALCTQAIAHSAAIKGTSTLCSAYILSGFALRSLGDFVNAQQYFQLALSAAQTLGHVKHIASASLQLGIVQSQSHRFGEAMESLKIARHYYAKAGSITGEAKVLYNVANVLILRDQPDEALSPLEEALTKYTEANDVVGSSQVLASIGLIHKQKGRYELAIEQLRQSLRLLQSLDQLQNELLVSLNLAECYIQLGDMQYADSMISGVHDRSLKMGLPLVQCRALLMRSNLESMMGRSESSEEIFAAAKLLAVAYGFEPQLTAMIAESNLNSTMSESIAK
jgi:tetratricopeptide (TPR) repeat protein